MTLNRFGREPLPMSDAERARRKPFYKPWELLGALQDATEIVSLPEGRAAKTVKDRSET